MSARPTTVVFDIGNVLLQWDPRNLYRKLFGGREEEMEWFLTNVCSPEWNLEQDRGRSFADAVTALIAQHPPTLHPMIRAYDERWHETLGGEIAGSVEIIGQLRRAGVPLYAITNWNQQKFHETRRRHAFFDAFSGIVVSGDERMLKPSPEIFHLLFDRYGLKAVDCLFVDDSLRNVEGARAVGMSAHHFTGPDALALALSELGLLR
jgi:2-haloacid dehalogenase